MGESLAHFALLSDLVRRRSGLDLPPHKAGLARSRLAGLTERFGFRSVDALLAELEDEPEELARAVTEALTTNETSFFRDPEIFAYLRQSVLPQLIRARAKRKRLRVWCAAASTGQEAYSLAMLFRQEGLYRDGWKVDLFATDLSRDAMRRAHEGLYAAHEVERGLPDHLRERYFRPEAEHWRVQPRLRRCLRLQRFNLLDSMGWLGEIDLILCRNALFYFENEARSDVLGRMARTLCDDGWLVLGVSETVEPVEFYTPAGEARGVFLKRHALRRAG